MMYCLYGDDELLLLTKALQAEEDDREADVRFLLADEYCFFGDESDNWASIDAYDSYISVCEEGLVFATLS
jgi:hypothetical protein